MSNLEETLGIQRNLESMTQKYDRMMSIMINRMKHQGKGLAQTCEEVLDGAVLFDSSDYEYIRGSA